MSPLLEKDLGTTSASRCVLLVGEADAVPSSLVAALDRRGIDIVIVRQPPQVITELAEYQTARGGSDAEDGETSVVVVEPQRQSRIGELAGTVASYYPQVRCWRYHAHGPDGRACLETLESDRMVHLQAQEPQDPVPHIKGAHQRLRSLVVKVDAPQSQYDGPLVSEEELAMLLGPDPTPANAAGGADAVEASAANASKNQRTGDAAASLPQANDLPASMARINARKSRSAARPAGEAGEGG